MGPDTDDKLIIAKLKEDKLALESKLEEYAKELKLFQELGQAMTSTLDLKELLDHVANCARKFIQADLVLVPLINDNKQEYYYAAASGEGAENIVGASFTLNVGMCGWVLANKRALVFAEGHEFEMDKKTLWEEGEKSALLVPLMAKKGIIGGLAGLGKRGEKSFSQHDIKMLTLFANTVSTAIENAGLYASLESKVKERTLEISTTNLKLQKATAEANAANLAKSVFLANMSHELRTPLNSILGFSQMYLHDGTLSSKQKQGIGFINKSGNHLLVLINDILDLSKIEAGKIEINTQPLRFKPFINTIESIMREQAASKDLSFIAPEARDLPEVIEADQFRLRQILLNLINNAIKFTAVGEVRFAVSVLDKQGLENQALRFEVIDTGTGIKKENLEAIFDPFEQVGVVTRQAEGTGLGLAISRKLVGLMGGELRVESEPGKGSRFWFDVTFPVHRESPEETVIGEDITGYKGKRLTALIADDKQDNLVLLQAMLSNLGFEVVTTTDGRQEVDMAIKVKPDIILTDLKMPVMDGNDAARAIRKVKELADTPIIAVSAGVMQVQKEESLQAGCNDFLDKPIQLPTLLKVLQKALGLEWTHEKRKEEESLTPSELALPPLDEIKKIIQAANLGNITTLKREISQVRDKGSKYHTFVDKLEKWSSQYQLDRIVEYLKPYSEK